MIMSWFVLLICSVIAFAHSKAASVIPRIYGGDNTTIEEHPYQVALLFNNNFICGGSLILSSMVLTAAHCTVYTKLTNLSVRVGSNSARFGGQTIKVRKMCVHPKYSHFTSNNDVSVLQLDHPVSLSRSVGVIELQSEGTAVPDGTKAEIIGWGRTETGKTATVLQSLTVKKVPQERCARVMMPKRVTSSMTCYTKSGANAGACFGDSGGPLIVNGKQVGITSWTRSSCDDSRFPTVFTSIAEKSISQHIQKCMKEFS